MDYIHEPAAYFSSRILVGHGSKLTPWFAVQHRITHVINCADDPQTPQWFKRSRSDKYFCINAIDSPYHNILDWYPMFESVLLRFLREGPGVVYVHCQAGMNRSAFLALTYVVKNYGFPLDTTIRTTQAQRRCMYQNTVFMNQVREFINGRFQSAQSSRAIEQQSSCDGNSRLPASDDRERSQGDQHYAGESTNGT